ncbi:SDR family NAD(P)-dependent oxidoreductase [Streptomyces sp. AK02-01A]|uniref:SDR family NAD(P)-dependent oxidoreductase n=1 Tax=Streptomyces sp. AK02-01A TaxID=3028648 RepID=UPI0029AD5C2A|nr:SDR family NAD(P)-dependent oxidoreductase [Streptomyces sp. AK02-01A]MDX3854895.1 SDR family NAD(P)-dependent oxidoreductase [Streptomyces sp. AK02-01A]
MTEIVNTPRIWFITGASSGIGLELTRKALAAGESVAAVSRAGAAPADLGPAERLLPIAADVRDEASVHGAVEQAVDRFGRIDVVANNAGYGLFGAVEEATDTQARAVFDTNVFGVLNVLRAVLPVLRRQRSGHILQGSSFYGQTADPGVGLLAATKYAVEGLSDALALEVAPLNIKVTLIQPALTATPFLGNLDAATRTHEDYDQTVRATQKAIGELPPSAFASVEGVAAGIRSIVGRDNPPRRLALGGSGAEAMLSALQARMTDLEKWAEITRSTDG